MSRSDLHGLKWSVIDKFVTATILFYKSFPMKSIQYMLVYCIMYCMFDVLHHLLYLAYYIMFYIWHAWSRDIF